MGCVHTGALGKREPSMLSIEGDLGLVGILPVTGAEVQELEDSKGSLAAMIGQLPLWCSARGARTIRPIRVSPKPLHQPLGTPITLAYPSFY